MQRFQDEIDRLKASAIAKEDYGLASRAKAVQSQLAELATQMEWRQLALQDAIFQQDFLAANELKGLQDGLLATAEQALQSLKQPVAAPQELGPASKKPASGKSAPGSSGSKAASNARAGKAPAKANARTGAKPPASTGGAGKPVGTRAAAAATHPDSAPAVAADDHMQHVLRATVARAQAAERICRAYRGLLAQKQKRRQQEEREAAATVHIQSIGRARDARRRDVLMRHALVAIQAGLRGWLVRARLSRRHAAAALAVQFLRDSNTASHWVDRTCEAIRKLRAGVRAVQAAQRRTAAIAEVNRRRAERGTETYAATVISAAARGQAARRMTGQLHERRAILRQKREQLARRHEEQMHSADIVRRFFESIGEMTYLRHMFHSIGGSLGKSVSKVQAIVRSRQAKRRILDMRERVRQQQRASSQIGARARQREASTVTVPNRAVDVLVGYLRERMVHRSTFDSIRGYLHQQRQALRARAAREWLAAVGVQAGIRGMKGRRSACALGEARRLRVHRHADEANRLAREAASIRLEAAWRGTRGRRRSVARRQSLKAEAACTQLQAAARRRLARRRVQSIRLLLQQQAAAVRLQSVGRQLLARRCMVAAASAAAVAPAVDVKFRLRCAPIARDALELAAQLCRLLRSTTFSPPLYLRPSRLLCWPSGLAMIASPSGVALVASSGGSGEGGGGGRGGGSSESSRGGSRDAVVLVVRLLPGAAPGEVTAVDAAAALLRVPIVELGLVIGATLSAPLSATLVMPRDWAPPAGGSSATRSREKAAPQLAASAGAEEGDSPLSITADGIGPLQDLDRLVDADAVGQAAAEAQRAHAAHTLLHYVRTLESASPADEALEADNGAMAGKRAPRPLAEPPVSRQALLSALTTLLPLTRGALHAARLTSVPPSDDEAPFGDDTLGDWRHFRAESAAVRAFVALQRPSPFEAAPRGPSVAGRRLRWVSKRIELACPPTPPTSYELDGVIEDGAVGAVGAYSTLAQPMVRASLRGISGCLLVIGDATASASQALFGELAHSSRLDGALSWAAAGARHGAATAGGRRAGLAGLVMSELLREADKWAGNGTSTGVATRGGGGGGRLGSDELAGRAGGASWQLHCSAFQLTAAGVVDLLQHPTSDLGRAPAHGGAARPGERPAVLPLRHWSGGESAPGQGTFAWPIGLAKVGIESPYDFSDMLATALSRRLEMAATRGDSRLAHALPQPPLCAPVAIVIDVTAVSVDGDTTTAQIVLWDLPSSVPPPLPPHTSTPSAERAAAAASRRSAVEESRALRRSHAALREVVDALGKTGDEAAAEAALAARGSILTLLLWRAFTADVATTCLCIASASEWMLPATLETVQLATAARQLRTRPRPRRRRAPLSMADLSAMLEDVEEANDSVASDEAIEAARAGMLVSDEWLDLPARLGYEPLLREIEHLSSLGAGGEVEARILRRLTRRLLHDVRRLHQAAPAAPPVPATPPLHPPMPAAAATAVAAPPNVKQDASEREAELVHELHLTQQRARAEAAEAELRRQQAQMDAVLEKLGESRAREAKLDAQQRELEKRLETRLIDAIDAHLPTGTSAAIDCAGSLRCGSAGSPARPTSPERSASQPPPTPEARRTKLVAEPAAPSPLSRSALPPSPSECPAAPLPVPVPTRSPVTPPAHHADFGPAQADTRQKGARAPGARGGRGGQAGDASPSPLLGRPSKARTAAPAAPSTPVHPDVMMQHTGRASGPRSPEAREHAARQGRLLEVTFQVQQKPPAVTPVARDHAARQDRMLEVLLEGQSVHRASHPELTPHAAGPPPVSPPSCPPAQQHRHLHRQHKHKHKQQLEQPYQQQHCQRAEAERPVISVARSQQASTPLEELRRLRACQ